MVLHVFFFNDTATTEIYTLSLHDALPILPIRQPSRGHQRGRHWSGHQRPRTSTWTVRRSGGAFQQGRSEEHTSELQSRQYLVCRLLLEKKTDATHAPLPAPPLAPLCFSYF